MRVQRHGIVSRILLSLGGLVVALALLEVPALLGLVDCRLVLPLPASFWHALKPWEDPTRRVDRELIHIRRPNQTLAGEGPGDLVHLLGIRTDRRYRSEMRYDRNGFRNDREIYAADIAVVGDSYVEDGEVPYAELLSTRLGRLLQVAVANLGQSHYGPQQELAVLRRYGIPLRPKLVVWVFFEGNDLSDAAFYELFVANWDAYLGDAHDVRRRLFTTNAVTALRHLLVPRSRPDGDHARRHSCEFTKSRRDDERTLYFFWAGPGLSEFERRGLEVTKAYLLAAQQVALYHDAKLLLLFVPTKFRVYRDLCQFPPDGHGLKWYPSELPASLESWSRAHGVPFIDVTSAFKAAAASGDLLYFPDDTHWNSRGNDLAATLVAAFIRDKRWLGLR